MSSRRLLVLIVASACASPPDLDESVSQLTGTTVVALTFDDTFADNYQVGALAEARGMRATFYVNSSRLGASGYMTRDQLLALQAAGHEIGGHTTTHADLAALDATALYREVCDDRAALLAAGFYAASFAYPFSSQNAAVRRVVADCGYNAARLVGGLVNPDGCVGCPYANPNPPPDPYQLRTNDSVKSTTTLDTLKSFVTNAEQNGGGFVPLVFHHVCDGCSSLAVSPATLAAFLDWLRPRAATGTIVTTVRDVIGGALVPVNLLQNPSLEADADGDQVPDCWQRGGTGTNTATYSLVADAFDGARAQRIDITSWTSGVRRLVSRQDTGTCAPAATPGHSYRVAAHYKSTAPVIFTIYYRTSAGSWVWFAQSAQFPARASYTAASYTTPALPSGATAISVGLTLLSAGSVTMDAFELVDTAPLPPEPPPPPPPDTQAPTARVASPAAGATVSGITTIWADATDNVGVYRVRFYRDGVQLGTRVQTTWRWNWDTTTTTVGPHTLSVQAEDAAGNATRSASITVNVVR